MWLYLTWNSVSFSRLLFLTDFFFHLCSHDRCDERILTFNWYCKQIVTKEINEYTSTHCFFVQLEINIWLCVPPLAAHHWGLLRLMWALVGSRTTPAPLSLLFSSSSFSLRLRSTIVCPLACFRLHATLCSPSPYPVTALVLKVTPTKMVPATVRVRQTTTSTSTSASVLLINTGYLKTNLGIIKSLLLASDALS